jgi:hypothetical protein
MLAFIKKVLGFGPAVEETTPYKVEAPVAPQITDAVTQAPAKKPRAKKAADAKPTVKKTTTRKPKAK